MCGEKTTTNFIKDKLYESLRPKRKRKDNYRQNGDRHFDCSEIQKQSDCQRLYCLYFALGSRHPHSCTSPWGLCTAVCVHARAFSYAV